MTDLDLDALVADADKLIGIFGMGHASCVLVALIAEVRALRESEKVGVSCNQDLMMEVDMSNAYIKELTDQLADKGRLLAECVEVLHLYAQKGVEHRVYAVRMLAKLSPRRRKASGAVLRAS